MDPTKIYDILRDRIIWLELPPESTLNLTDLAEEFGVSRTPVKEALILLQAEGWVQRHGAHFMVSPLTLDRMREITEIRSVMEIQANIWAMYRIQAEELAELDQIKQDIHTLDDSVTNRRIVEMDVRFHRIIFKALRNSQLAQLLERFLSHYLRFWLAAPHVIKPETFFIQTLEIIDAIQARDEVRLRAASAEHVKNSINEIMGVHT